MTKKSKITDKIQFSVYFDADLFRKLEHERGIIKRSTYVEMIYAKSQGAEA